jgi:hypothetical protein
MSCGNAHVLRSLTPTPTRASRPRKKAEISARIPVFRFKVAYFLVGGVGWRGTCKPIAHDENGYRSRKSAERDECLSRCFLRAFITSASEKIC